MLALIQTIQSAKLADACAVAACIECGPAKIALHHLAEGLSCSQLMIALEYCHGKGVVNRDLKPENCLVFAKKGMPYVKLCDFG